MNYLVHKRYSINVYHYFSPGLERLLKEIEEKRKREISEEDIKTAKLIEEIRKIIFENRIATHRKSKNFDLKCKTWSVLQVQNWLSAQQLNFLSTSYESVLHCTLVLYFHFLFSSEIAIFLLHGFYRLFLLISIFCFSFLEKNVDGCKLLVFYIEFSQDAARFKQRLWSKFGLNRSERDLFLRALEQL